MARTATTPDFMTAPNVGEFIGLALDDYADQHEQHAAENGHSRTAAAMVRMYRRAAKQLLAVHADDATT